MSVPDEDLTGIVALLRRRVARELAARSEAERLLEAKSLELYDINQKLVALNADLEARVSSRTIELERERRQAVALAERDLLTGVANRRRLQACLDAAVADCADGETQAALLVVDLDRFKQVNDRFGHAAGDALLIEMAERLSRVCGEAGLVARLGGDEFAVLLQGHGDGLASGRRWAERILRAAEAPLSEKAHHSQPSCSIGFAATPGQATTSADLLRYADLALYSAKAAGRGRYAAFDPSMVSDLEERVALEQDLRDALETGGITVWFQPIVDAQSGRIVAAEALARWPHPTRGMIPPDRFIAIAEERGLIVEVGKQVLAATCSQARPMLRDGLLRRVSVNFSPLQLQDAEIVGFVRDTVRRNGIAPAQLLIEVTESVMLTDHPAVRQTIEALRAEGIGLALDDFGAGYSNLSYLTQLKVDVLKIDRSFVAELETEFATGAMIRNITALAHELGVTVVVEGVETARQRELIVSYGCDFIQGYLFSKPLPVTALSALLGAAGDGARRSHQPNASRVA